MKVLCVLSLAASLLLPCEAVKQTKESNNDSIKVVENIQTRELELLPKY